MLQTISIFFAVFAMSLSQQQQSQPPQDQSIIFDVTQFIDDRGSFGLIVTPATDVAPLIPSTINSNSQRDQCNCVPYHACDDNSRSSDVNSDGRLEVSFYNGTCQHYLDVCCGASTFQPAGNSGQTFDQTSEPQPTIQIPVTRPPSSLPPPSPTSNPTYSQYQNKGCGIRNDGGIDFTVNDVDVSN